MIYDQKRLLEFDGFLERLAKTLDLTEAQYRDACDRYEKLGAFLNEPDSSLAPYNPLITPQGSFALGTMIKPETDEEQFDVDLTCQLQLSKDEITQQQLKQMVGDRLKESPVYSRILGKEKRRCWPLEYANGTQFHMDVVPAIPDEQTRLLLRNLFENEGFADTAICITDRLTWNSAPDWPRCNPKGYAAWFKERMRVRFDEMRLRILNAEKRGKVEDIPEFKIKTPLQRAVQILKRHRDRRFEGDPELKPISVILTTLAACAYNNEDNIYRTMINLLDRMPGFIKFENGHYIIENPIDPRENFANKWNEDPRKAKAFFDWLETAKIDLKNLLALDGLDKITLKGGEIFGERAMRGAMNLYGEEMRILRESTGLRMEKNGFLNATGPAIVRPHQFSKNNITAGKPLIASSTKHLDIEMQADALHMTYPGAEVRFVNPLSFYDTNLRSEDMSIVLDVLSRKTSKPLLLVCDLNLQPTAMSRAYWVRILYTVGRPPKVFVKYPTINRIANEILPHFNPDDSLCLYHTNQEWAAYMLLAETIVPWTSEWLLHYEVWKGTQKWQGGGH